MNDTLAEGLVEGKRNIEWVGEVGNNNYHLRFHDQVQRHRLHVYVNYLIVFFLSFFFMLPFMKNASGN